MHDLIIVYLAGLTGIWKAIPIGMMLKISPILVGLLTLSGSCTTVTMLYLFGGWVTKFIEARAGQKGMRKKKIRAERLLSRYGIVGLGLIGTVAMGPAVTIIAGMCITRANRKLLVWTIIGISLWITIITAAAATGLQIFGRFGSHCG